MKSPDLDEIEGETYAHIVRRFVFDNEGDKPRVILLGFSYVSAYIRKQFQHEKVRIIEPERTSRLKEASLVRKTNQPCVILIGSKKNLGKFASLVTAFKLLSEDLSLRGVGTNSSVSDTYDLSDMSIWLAEKNIIQDICSFIETKLEASLGLNYEGIGVILGSIRKMAERKPSYIEWLHPRRMTRGLVHAIHREQKHGGTTVAFFLRSVSIEPKRALEDVHLFSEDIKKEENLKELEDTLVQYPKILKLYYACTLPRQRTSLANFCMNHLRNRIYTLARREWNSSRGMSKWIRIMLEFERVMIVGAARKRRRKKYRSLSRGVRVYKRSPVSGLPSRFQLPLEISRDDGRNLLIEFYKSELEELQDVYSELLEPAPVFLSMKPSNLKDETSELTMELDLANNGGRTFLDPYIAGTKTPTRKINILLTEISRKQRGLQ